MIRTAARYVCFMFILLVVVFPRDVHAYLDPGTGSLMFQAVVAGLAAAAYTVRSYWSSIRTWFGRSSTNSSGEFHDRA